MMHFMRLQFRIAYKFHLHISAAKQVCLLNLMLAFECTANDVNKIVKFNQSASQNAFFLLCRFHVCRSTKKPLLDHLRLSSFGSFSFYDRAFRREIQLCNKAVSNFMSFPLGFEFLLSRLGTTSSQHSIVPIETLNLISSRLIKNDLLLLQVI